MNINRDNYGAYFLDFIEGNLTAAQEEVLHRFLKFNPDLEAELNDFELHTIDASIHPYPGKDALKKELPENGAPVNDANFDMFCVAWLEGDLPEDQKEYFESYLAQHPDKEIEVAAYKTAYLAPATIKYPHKRRLKKRTGRLIDWRIFVPVAAAAAIALVVIVNTPVTQPPVEVATVTETDQGTQRLAGPERVGPEKMDDQEQTGSKQADSEQAVTSRTDEQSDQQKQAQPSEAQKVQATFNMVRKTNSPVPVSDFTDEEKIKLQQQNSDREKQPQSSPSRRIAGLDLRKQQVDPVFVPHDQIRPESIQPPTINSSSLSILALARYQAQKASQIMEEEDALLWNLASSGLKELNRITGSETELLASRDEDGAISGIRFKSRFLNVTAPIAREE